MTSFIDIIESGYVTHSQRNGSILQGKMLSVLLAVNNAQEKGITTREVAEVCDLSVYSARNWLMRLEEEGHIRRCCRPRNTTWHIS